MDHETHFTEVVLPKYAAVEGWLAVTEAFALYTLAHRTPQGSTVVEIGSYKGKSAVVMASALVPPSRLYCIDPFNGAGAWYYSSLQGQFEDFTKNIRLTGLDHIVESIKGYSAEVAKFWKLPIDLLFIDGDHTYTGALDDLRLWTPFLKSGGILAMHDVFFPEEAHVHGYEIGPFSALQEFNPQPEQWHSGYRTNSLLLIKKR